MSAVVFPTKPPYGTVEIIGGTITGITDLAVADGGTGASSAPSARSNLGAAAQAAVTDGRINVPLSGFLALSGTWTRTRPGVAIVRLRRTAGAASEQVAFEVPVASRGTADRGRKLTGFEFQYRISVEAANDVTVAVNYNNTPADTVALGAGTALTVVYPADHDTASERGAIAQHTMIATISDGVFFNDLGTLEFLVTIDDTTGGGAVFDIFQIVLLTTDALVD